MNLTQNFTGALLSAQPVAAGDFPGSLAPAALNSVSAALDERMAAGNPSLSRKLQPRKEEHKNTHIFLTTPRGGSTASVFPALRTKKFFMSDTPQGSRGGSVHNPIKPGHLSHAPAGSWYPFQTVTAQVGCLMAPGTGGNSANPISAFQIIAGGA